MKISYPAFIIFIFIILPNCSSPDNATAYKKDPKFKQYMVQGEILYNIHCSACHQRDGSGLGLIYPPLNTSDYMEENFEKVICLIKNGIEGEIIVNGKSYNMEMPALTSLSNLEIAEISTYIYNNWSHERGKISTQEVSKILDSCK
jgi:cytochrome c551